MPGVGAGTGARQPEGRGNRRSHSGLKLCLKGGGEFIELHGTVSDTYLYAICARHPWLYEPKELTKYSSGEENTETRKWEELCVPEAVSSKNKMPSFKLSFTLNTSGQTV